MSLREAVLEIADDIEQFSDTWDGDCMTASDVETMIRLQGYAKQLRSAVKASEGERQSYIVPFGGDIGVPTGDKTIDGGIILKTHGCDPDGPAKAQQRLADIKRIERAAELEDSDGVRMVEILDGSNDGLCEMHQVPMSMQVGQALDIGRRVFVLKRLDNGTLQLHLHAAETERRFGAKGGA